MGPQKENPEDLASLGDLYETILVEELHQRYNIDRIYTYIGAILISINHIRNYRDCTVKSLGYDMVKLRHAMSCFLMSTPWLPVLTIMYRECRGISVCWLAESQGQLKKYIPNISKDPAILRQVRTQS